MSGIDLKYCKNLECEGIVVVWKIGKLFGKEMCNRVGEVVE